MKKKDFNINDLVDLKTRNGKIGPKKFKVIKGSEHECCLDYSVKSDIGTTVCECPGRLEAEMICNALNLIAR